MDILADLICAYPNDNVTLADFVGKLTPGSDMFLPAIAAVALSFIGGFAMYIIPIFLLEKEHVGPYPMWLHCFYLAADFMGLLVFSAAWLNSNFWFFLVMAIGEALWVCLELYSLQRATTYENSLNFKPNASKAQMWGTIIFYSLSFFIVLNTLRIYLHDEYMWKFWSLTNIPIIIFTYLTMRQHGYRNGNCKLLNYVFVYVVIVNFMPGINLFHVISPAVFSPESNPWYYIMGIVLMVVAICNIRYYSKLPEKSDVMGSGKKPLLK